MAVTQTAVVDGVVVRTSERTFTKKDTGEVFTFRNALIIGDDCLVDAGVPDSIPMPQKGDVIRARVAIQVYRSDVDVRIDELLPLVEVGK